MMKIDQLSNRTIKGTYRDIDKYSNPPKGWGIAAWHAYLYCIFMSAADCNDEWTEASYILFSVSRRRIKS